jgi:2-polyprenyl-3-methyl-5-hydroxy-6-metoxy-1,4-benzoquinol methylase
MKHSKPECVLCGNLEKDLLLSIEKWKVFKCRRCGLGMLDPRPANDVLAGLYEAEYFGAQYDQGLPPGSPELVKRLRSESHRVDFVRKIKTHGRILDIGCGYGYFLAACREKGFEVCGLDVSPWAVDYASKKLGLQVVIGDTKATDFPRSSFDIITMWHTLEHTDNPVEVLEVTAGWLKPDGIIAIDVPNYESTDAIAMKDKWIGWQLPYHLWHFSPKSLFLLLEKTGFLIKRSKTYHSETVKARLKKNLFLRPVARLISKAYSGTSIAVLAERDRFVRPPD